MSLSSVSMEDMEDRLSALPDELLTHILTFLPIEEAVWTGILSKRWIDVWTSLQILVFDDDHEHLGADLTDEEFLQHEFKFLLFVRHVLFRRKTSPLDTFKLRWCGKFRVTYSYISKLLSFAALRMPRVLSISIDTKEPFILPGSIFTCPSVQEMSLELYFDADNYCIGAESINLPHLRKLDLYCQLINDDFITMLFSGCPILEELFFDSCCFDLDEISSTVLKKLTFKDCEPLNEIQISCQGVVSLGIDFFNLEGITLRNMPSLVTADLVFVSSINPLDHDVKLLSGLSNVASLRLSTNLLMDLQATDILNCPDFNNIKILDLGELDMNLHWKLVGCILQHSPNLETLTMHFCNCQPSEGATKEELLGNVAFQLEYLETLNILCCNTNATLFSEEVVRRLSVFIKSIGEVTTCRKAVCFARSLSD